MTLIESLTANSISLDSLEWSMTLKQARVRFPVDIDKINCIKAYSCVFTLENTIDSIKINNKQGFVIIADTGIAVLCPLINDFPITSYIPKKDIRVVESEVKLFKSMIRIRTNTEVYVFKCNKEDIKEIEKNINKIRST